MVRANTSEIERLMELNEFTVCSLAKKANLCYYTIKRVLSGGEVTLRSMVKVSVVLKCYIGDILLKSETIQTTKEIYNEECNN